MCPLEQNPNHILIFRIAFCSSTSIFLWRILTRTAPACPDSACDLSPAVIPRVECDSKKDRNAQSNCHDERQAEQPPHAPMLRDTQRTVGDNQPPQVLI